jgi:hypothetical protein
LLIRIVLSGPDECVIAVRVSGGFIIGTTAKQILDSACAWLLSRQGQTEGMIDIESGERSARRIAPTNRMSVPFAS